MKTLILLVAALALPGIALAKPAAQAPAPVAAPPPPVAVSSPYTAAPWWMRDEVVAQTGFAFVDMPANRAGLSATFRGVDKTVAGAQGKAMDQVRGLQEALAKLGREKAEIGTDFTMRALYQEYRDRDGNRIEDERGDRITGYEVTVKVEVTVRDTAELQRVYGLLMAATPAETAPVTFWLEADNALVGQIESAALRDARTRAQGAASAAGASLGGVKLIDPTGSACSSDILARSPDADVDLGIMGGYAAPPPPVMAPAAEAMEVVVTGNRKAMPKTAADIEAQAARNPFAQTPPVQRLTATACVVYGLN